MGGGAKVWCGERAASGRVASSSASSMTPEPILAPLILGRRPKHVCHHPSLGLIRYNKLEKVTDVRYTPPLNAKRRYRYSEPDPALQWPQRVERE